MKKVSIILTIVGSLCLAGGLGYGLYRLIGNGDSTDSDRNTLNTASNVKYDDENYLLKWDQVQNADSYNISINDSKDYISVKENKLSYVPTEDVVTFSIQACDTTGTYNYSGWTEKLTYNVDVNNVSYVSINSLVQKMIPYKLKKVISINIDGNRLVTNAIFTNSGKTKIYNLRTTYEHELTSLKDAIDEKLPHTSIRSSHDIVNFNSAECLLKSNSYTGTMEELRLQGYKFEIVSQQTCSVENDNQMLIIYATYKATKGNDIKYIFNSVNCTVNEKNPNINAKYTILLENPATRKLRELSTKILIGDEITVAEQMYKANHQ